MESNKKQKIYMDALNFGNYFFKKEDFWDLGYIVNKVKTFVYILRKRNYDLEIFLDGNSRSKLIKEVYKERVIERMKTRKFDWPTNCTNLLEYAFSSLGIKVHYNIDQDCDDTLATYAYIDDAFILSSDNDFLCYFKDLKIYSKFELDEKKDLIFFTRQTRRTKDHKPKRKICELKRSLLQKKPITVNTMTADVLLSPNRNILTSGFPMNCPSLLVNPHTIVKELRRALYYSWGIKNIVTEEIPRLNPENNEVEWSVEEIDPLVVNPLFLEMLKHPNKALE